MNNRFSWINYKDCEILYLDFSDLYGELLKKGVRDFREFVIAADKKNIRILLNAPNVFIYDAVFEEAKKNSILFKEIIKKVGIVGSTKVQEVFIKILSRISKADYETFNSFDEAKEWLIQD